MADPKTIQQSYSEGMKRDGARDALAQGVLWNGIDWVPELSNVRMAKRGGWSNASASLPVGGYQQAGIVADYTAGQSHLAVTDQGAVYAVQTLTALETIGTVPFGTRSPFFYNDFVILPDASGVQPPRKVIRVGNLHQISLLAGSPAPFRYGLAYKDVTWGLSPINLPKRIYFSVAGNPESWDLVNKYLDVSYPITGAIALSNAVLVFMLGRTARIRGSIPPPDTDFVLDDPQFEVGCTDNRSIAAYRDKAIWANAAGLWISDGTALEDLTRICGMKTWWRDIMLGQDGFSTGAEYNPATWTIAGGIYGDYYVYAIHNSTTLVDSGMIDLSRFTWHRHANLRAATFYRRSYPDELFMGMRNQARAGSFSDIFEPGPLNTADGNGDVVEPIFETGFFPFGQPGTKTMRRLYAGYDLRDTLANLPEFQLSYLTSPEATAYTNLSPRLAPTSAYSRVYRPLSFPALGIAFKGEQFGRSDSTLLYDLELDAQPRERHR